MVTVQSGNGKGDFGRWYRPARYGHDHIGQLDLGRQGNGDEHSKQQVISYNPVRTTGNAGRCGVLVHKCTKLSAIARVARMLPTGFVQKRLASIAGLGDACPPMSNWEYKIISSGKGGFASPALMEKFLNDLGQESWEIISFHQPADNALAFHGLARRSTERDWTLEDAAKAAARVEADKLRVEFEAKFKAGSNTATPAEEPETFLADEQPGAEGSIRSLRDTSRDDDPEGSDDDNSKTAKDEWDKLAEEDELPAFFDALRPHMRRNQRGAGMSVGLDHLAKKWQLDESDLKTALVECGLQIPADENAEPVYAEYEGELYWVNINRRGEIWINLRDKPQPVFRIVQAKRVPGAELPTQSDSGNADGNLAPVTSEQSATDMARTDRKASPSQKQSHREQQPALQQPSKPRTFLEKIRGMMRRNRRGHGSSGSFHFLTKALKLDEAQLLAQLHEHGLSLAEGQPPVEVTEGDFVYWLNKNQRKEIWINAELIRKSTAHAPADTGGRAEQGVPIAAGVGDSGSNSGQASLERSPRSPENTLTAVRLLMEPKKRGEGVTVQMTVLAEKLEMTAEALLATLAAVGLHLPETPKSKPTFAEHGGELYWLNLSAKHETWVNAKPVSATRKPRTKKTAGST